MSESFQRQPTHEEIVEGIARGIYNTLVNRGELGEPLRRAFREAIEEGIATGLQRLFDGRITTLTNAVRDGVSRCSSFDSAIADALCGKTKDGGL